MFEIGEWTGEGLETGIASMKRDVERSAGLLAESAVPDIEKSLLPKSLRGVTANSLIGNIVPSSLQVQQSIIHSQSNANRYDDGEVKELLKKLVDKDGNVYLSKEKVGSIMDKEQARRIKLLEGWVAID